MIKTVIYEIQDDMFFLHTEQEQNEKNSRNPNACSFSEQELGLPIFQAVQMNRKKQTVKTYFKNHF